MGNRLKPAYAETRGDINSSVMKHYLRLFCVLLSLLSFSAMAQWAWVDSNGRKIFSDRGPPADIPAKSIFKRPGPATTVVTSESAVGNTTADSNLQAASAPQDKASAAKPSGVDPVLAERKKKEEQAVEAKRKTEQERISRLKAENCERAKLAKKGMDSGVRLARTNAKGEREIMDDAARAAESQRIQSIVDADCK
jgi:hypothetical protein